MNNSDKRRPAPPVRKMAADPRIIEVLQPWIFSELPNAGNWVGKTEDQWIAHTQGIKGRIIERLSGKTGDNFDRSSNRLVQELIEDEQYSKEGAEDAIKSILPGKRKDKQLPINQRVISEIDISTPSVNADEQISRLALELSGFDGVDFNNNSSIHNTDFTLPIGKNQAMGIDAQQFFNTRGDLRMGVVQHIQGGRAAFEGNADTPFGKIVNELRERAKESGDRWGGQEDKLLQTPDSSINPIHLASKEFKQLDADIQKQKDYLIVSNRGNQRNNKLTNLTKSIQYPKGKIKGPYNPTKPEGLDLVSLIGLRDKLMEMTPNQMIREGIDLPDRMDSKSLALTIPRKVYKDIVDPGGRELNPDVVRQITNQVIRRGRR